MNALETNNALRKKATILIVDDQSTNIRSLSAILSETYTIMMATSGVKALEIARSEKKPDLILLDVQMPKMDGYEVLRRINADESTREIPVIFVTASNAAAGDEAMGLELGAVDYISKPYTPDVVQLRVKQRLERQQAEEKIKAANQKLNAQNQQLKANNQQLIDSEKKLQSMKILMEGTLNAIPDIIGIQDNDHHVIMYNQAGYDFLNITREAASGKKCYELIGKTKPCNLCASSKCYNSKKPEQVERYEESLGVWLDVRAYPILDNNGKIEMVIEHLRDITKRKHVEAELAKHQKHLEELVKARTEALQSSNKELEAFAYSVSHDLRAPLRAINGFTRILMEDYVEKLDDEGKRLGAVIRKNTGKMDKLIDDLLTFSRLGRSAMQVFSIDMKNLAIATYHEALGSSDSKRINFSVADLPDVNGDPNMLRQVWINLISNAIKFTSKREKAVITITGMQDDENITYLISDNGAGFDMKYKNKMFGVFQRLHNESDFKGTGAGLALVQRIINRHNGKVWAESEEDKGATFYFSLPKRVNAGV